MWMKVTENIDQVLWEGELVATSAGEAAPLPANAYSPSGRLSQGRPDATVEQPDSPIVSVGRPEVWALEDILSAADMPATVRAKLDEAAFFVAQLACSFRPSDRLEIERARLVATLLPDAAGNQAIAFDAHPLLVQQEIKRDIKVALSPSIKFSEVEVKPGQIDFGFEYTELRPTIVAAGVQEPAVSWDFSRGAGVPLVGVRKTHILIKAPKSMRSGWVALTVSANARERGFHFPIFDDDGERAARALKAPLWSVSPGS